MTAWTLHEAGGGLHLDLSPFGSADVKTGAEETGDTFCVVEFTMNPGGPPTALHRHHKTHEFFYMLAGEGQVLLGDETMPTRPGTFCYVPPGTWHGFEITGDRARALVMGTPAALYQAVVEAFGRLYVGGPPDAAKTASVFAGLDIEFPVACETVIGKPPPASPTVVNRVSAQSVAPGSRNKVAGPRRF